MRNKWSKSPLLGLLLVGILLAGCGGGQSGSATDRGAFKVTLISNGFSPQIYPYRIRVADSNGNPTSQILNITKMEDL